VSEAFAIWITGLPASGKSTITKALVTCLRAQSIHPAVLESDELRRVLTPIPTYGEQERDMFYRQLIGLGAILAGQGVPVVFDATAHRRIWRDEAKRVIPGLIEIYVNSPLPVCIARDPKGIYARAKRGKASSVPGLQTEYEAPRQPDLVVGGSADPDENADKILRLMQQRAIGVRRSGDPQLPYR
jgi:adenylylsulfate kinase